MNGLAGQGLGSLSKGAPGQDWLATPPKFLHIRLNSWAEDNSVARLREILYYRTQAGKCPVREWLHSFNDQRVRLRIEKRIARLEDGNFGDYRSLGGGLVELRLMFGAGYRVYFSDGGGQVVVLLAAGDKATQERDIKKARSMLLEFLENQRRTDSNGQ